MTERRSRSRPERGTPELELDVHAAEDDDDDDATVELRRSRRGLRRAAVVVVVAVVTAVVIAVSSDRSPKRLEPLATTPGTVASGTTEPTVVQVPPIGPFRLSTGPLFEQPTGLSVVVKLAADLYRLDLDTALATPISVDGITHADGTGSLTSLGVVVADVDGRLYLAPGAPAPKRLVEGGASSADGSIRAERFVGEGPPGRLWISRGASGSGLELGYVEPAGAPGFTAVALPAFDFAGEPVADGIGGLVFDAPGGVYRWTPGAGAVRRITTGTMRDVPNGSVLTVECDEALACAWQVLDLRTGAAWRSPTGSSSVSLSSPARLSPDGRRFVVASTRPSPVRTVFVVDETGASRTLEMGGPCADQLCSSGASW